MKKLLITLLTLIGFCVPAFAQTLEDVKAEQAYHRVKEAVF